MRRNPRSRAAASALSLLLASSAWPAGAAAQALRGARPAAGSAAVPVFAGPGLPPSLASPALTRTPALSLSGPAPSVSPVPVPAPSARPSSPAAAAVKSLSARVRASETLTRSLPDVPVDAAPRAAEESFSLLGGETLVDRGEGGVLAASREDAAPHGGRPFLPAPGAPRGPRSPEAAKNVRRMMIGTAAMKSGMETVTLSVPLLALSALGGASVVAALVVAYGASQAVFAGAAGSLADRFSARKVLAGAVFAQAALVGAVMALGALHALSLPTLLPLYVLIGGAVGIAETARHSIPALIVGQDGEALNRYNAKLHIAYETAGVAGALAAGALIGLAGPLWSLLIQPPAYLLAAYFFLGVRHDRPAGVEPAALARRGVFAGLAGRLKAYAADVKAGAKLVLGDGRLRSIAAAFVLPQIVHRVFENLLIPVFAKTVLHAPQSSAWLLTASNLGELVGAVLLLRLAARFKGPAAWVKWCALGLLLTWSLASTTSLPVLLPLILVSSLSWAASDLRLRSEVQRTVPEKDQPRALSFLYGAFVLGSAAASFALGGFMDWLGVGRALYWICGAIAALAAAVFLAARRLKPSP